MDLDELVKLLRCPIDHQPVETDGQFIICTACDAHYPIVDNIPYMVVEEAQFPHGKRQPNVSHPEEQA